ncbi:hypothetical protein [Xanthomonas hortorum]|nr:hypothetical protein [Xanthomonas hortorum]
MKLWLRIAAAILINNVDHYLHVHGFLHVQHGRGRWHWPSTPPILNRFGT